MTAEVVPLKDDKLPRYRIKLHEVELVWGHGDIWVIQGVGETNVQQQVKKDIFLAAYEPVEGDAQET